MIPMRLEINEKIKSIMIVVPHQDDEILMTAGVIRRAVEAGVACTVLMATNGDYGCKDFSKRVRQTEREHRRFAGIGTSGNSI